MDRNLMALFAPNGAVGVDGEAGPSKVSDSRCQELLDDWLEKDDEARDLDSCCELDEPMLAQGGDLLLPDDCCFDAIGADYRAEMAWRKYQHFCLWDRTWLNWHFPGLFPPQS